MNIRNRIIDYRTIKASELLPHPNNWRKHPKAQQDAIRGILAEVGFVDALMVRLLPGGKYQIVDGHLRAETAPDMDVPVLVVDLDDAEAAKVLATFDPIGAMAEADKANLDAILKDVETQSDALREMLEGLAKDAGCEWAKGSEEVVEDEVPEAPEVPVTKPGDLWLLGRHRLLCGDSTKAEDVERLMAGAKADVIWTDPPYGVNHIGGTKDPRRKTHRSGGVVHNDDKTGHGLVAMVSAAIGSIPKHDSTVLYVASPAGANVREMIDAFNGSGFAFRHSLVWVKHAFVFGRADYHYKHELILYGWGERHEWSGERDISTVFEFPRGDKTVEHPTSKPVGLVAGTAKNHPASVMADPFLGSGTTLIAAEQLGRKCYGMEISPQYCDVIVKRWENLTGEKARLA